MLPCRRENPRFNKSQAFKIILYKGFSQLIEMSAYELTHSLVAEILSDENDLIVCNYANGDMVGHTGSFDAAVKAVEVLDECLAQVVEVTLKTGGIV